ncbi:MAG TPA: adenylate/guanylate cyclase domain-containing protein [Acidimicrobiia bacterium]|nr:adenylate/guanylate cyclase domain-containing protein [Acidimicrobiia bacterium]
MGDTVVDTLAAGREAFTRHEWKRAYDLFHAADADGQLDPADLEQLAEAARWSRHHPDVLGAFERAQVGFARSGDRRSAARAALKLAWENFTRNDDAVATGWFGQAATLLESDTECAEYGLFLIVSGYTMLMGGNIDAGRELLEQARDVGRRVGDQDVEGLASIYLGHALVTGGDQAAGLAMVDEATAAAMSGRLGVQAAGTIYCSTIFLCRNIGDWRRAGEWTDASTRWCQRESVSEFPGLCRFHHAEIMRFRGALADAEEDALSAVDELMGSAPRWAGFAYHELGEVRRRRGDLAGAAEAFRRSAAQGFDPQPGAALLRLDEGDAAGAQRAIRRAVADDSVLAQEGRALVLPAQVTIEIAAGDLEAARGALESLEDRVSTSGSGAFGAAAATARGELALAEQRAGDAAVELRRAWQAWQDVDAPYEGARTRVLLARAYRAEGDEDAAVVELESAQSAFERIGAVRESSKIAGFLTPPGDARAVRTFMFTDIVDSTRLVELLGDDAWENLLAWHDRTLRGCFDEHQGEEVKHEGDGFFVAFTDGRAALECAIATQRTLDHHRREHGFAPQVRIGVHAAEATERGGDYGGKGVHTAARIGASASADEIVASQGTLDGLDDAFTTSAERALQLKGLAEPVLVATVDWR